MEYSYHSGMFIPCKYSDRLLEKLERLNIVNEIKFDIEEIKKAIHFAKLYHGDQKRQSGEPYYSHVIEVAYMTSDYISETDIVIVSLLHDIIEDTEVTQDFVASIFGESIASKVMDLTRVVVKDKKSTSQDMVYRLWREKKYDIMLIKLCDRMHNMLTLSYKPSNKIKKTAEETLTAFIVLAAYLGTKDIENKLTELCMRYINVGLIDQNEIENLSNKELCNKLINDGQEE